MQRLLPHWVNSTSIMRRNDFCTVYAPNNYDWRSYPCIKISFWLPLLAFFLRMGHRSQTLLSTNKDCLMSLRKSALQLKIWFVLQVLAFLWCILCSILSVYAKLNFDRFSGERPFRCALCGKTFSRSTILKAHEKTHYPKYVRKFLSPSPVDTEEESPH